MELWVMGPHRTRVVTFNAFKLQGMTENNLSTMSVTTSVPRARDEENHLPARLDEADQLAKFLSIGGHRNVINNRDNLYGQVVHRSVYISRELSLLRRV